MSRRRKIKKWIPLIILIVVMLFVYFSGVLYYLSFEKLQMYRQNILNLVTEHPILTPFLFILVYTIAMTLCLPIAISLSLIGGFLFFQPLSTLYIVIGATVGGTGLFLITKTAFSDFLKKKAGPFMHKIEKGFQEDGSSYLLFLRISPIFPFQLVTLAAAFLHVRLWTFIWTTFVGIIPGSFVLAQAGRGLGAILDSQEGLSLGSIFNWEVKIALIALAVFALIPLIIKKIRNH